MNPGPLEEGAKAAAGFIESMKSQPLALALAICNILLLGLFFYIAQWSGANRALEFKMMMEAQKEVQKLLYSCTPITPSGLRLQSDESKPAELQGPPS